MITFLFYLIKLKKKKMSRKAKCKANIQNHKKKVQIFLLQGPIRYPNPKSYKVLVT